MGSIDFRYNAYTPTFGLAPQNNPYVFHPGIVGGVFGVRNIRETDAIPDFTATLNKLIGENYIDVKGESRPVTALTLPADRLLEVLTSSPFSSMPTWRSRA